MILTCTLLLAGGLSVELHGEVKVRGTELRLGEIARIESTDAELLERARALSLGYAPAPGYSRRLDGWSLEREIERALHGIDVTVTGAQACRVLPEVEHLTAEELVQVARKELQATYAANDVTFENEGGTRDIEIPAGREGRLLRARIEQRGAQTGLIAVPIDVLVDGELYQTVWTNWRVTVWRELPVLAHDVQTGETLTTTHFRRQRVRMELSSAEAHLTEAAASGAVLVRSLSAGSVVLNRDVRRPRLVSRGDIVQLRVRKGAITATATATAFEDGFLGDKIRVITSAQRELRAVIVGRDLVSIELSSDR